MRDPGLAQLERSITDYCDDLLSSQVVQEDDQAILTVHWVYRGGEFRATLLLPPGHRISLRDYIRWHLRGRQFRLLPSRPAFEWFSPIGWQRAHTPAQWRRVLANTGDAAPGNAPGDLAGRPVRPRPGLPSLRAGAVAIPEPPLREYSHHATVTLPRGAADDERGMAWR